MGPCSPVLATDSLEKLLDSLKKRLDFDANLLDSLNNRPDLSENSWIH